jgi:hypothetical protein
MPEFEMLSSEKVEFNMGGEFLELSFNIVRDGKRETKYLRLARGYYGSDGEPRYKKGGVTLPNDKAAIQALAKKMLELDLTPLGPPKTEKGAPAPDE